MTGKTIFILSFSVSALLIIILAAVLFAGSKTDSNVVSVVDTASDEVATTPPTEVAEITLEEVSVVLPVEAEASAPTAPLRAQPECIIIDDFADGVPKLQWYTVNDGVMGGLSQGSASLDGESLVHSGVLNTNGGGFSYVGARLPKDILVGYTRLQVRLDTFGRAYAVNFGDARNRRISHQAAIPLGPAESWQEVFIDFDQTVPTIFSRQVNSAAFAASEIEELSFILGDGIDGPFQMEIDWIKACR